MGIENATNQQGREAAEGLERAAERDEERTEAHKGSPLEKGAERFEERSRSSDGRDAGSKQLGVVTSD